MMIEANAALAPAMVLAKGAKGLIRPQEVPKIRNAVR